MNSRQNIVGFKVPSTVLSVFHKHIYGFYFLEDRSSFGRCKNIAEIEAELDMSLKKILAYFCAEVDFANFANFAYNFQRFRQTLINISEISNRI